MKWKDHKKQVDKLYLADVFVNVGKDIINTIYFKTEKIVSDDTGDTDDYDKILHDSITELNNFITYYNEQYTIISISHTMVGKKIQYVDCKRQFFERDKGTGAVYYKSYEINEKTISCKISDVKNK